MEKNIGKVIFKITENLLDNHSINIIDIINDNENSKKMVKKDNKFEIKMKVINHFNSNNIENNLFDGFLSRSTIIFN